MESCEPVASATPRKLAATYHHAPRRTRGNPTVNGPHLSAASNASAAEAMAAYYVQHP